MKRRFLLPCLVLAGFMLGIRDGYIALWKDGRPEVWEVFPYRAQMLPEADQKILSRGIRAENREDLARLLEDYLS